MSLPWIERSYVTTIENGVSNWRKLRSFHFWEVLLASRSMSITPKRCFAMPIWRSLRDVDVAAQDEITLNNPTA